MSEPELVVFGNPVRVWHVMVALLVMSVLAGLIVAAIFVKTMVVIPQPPSIPS